MERYKPLLEDSDILVNAVSHCNGLLYMFKHIRSSFMKMDIPLDVIKEIDFNSQTILCEASRSILQDILIKYFVPTPHKGIERGIYTTGSGFKIEVIQIKPKGTVIFQILDI